MQYRIDPKNGKELSILGFGCMRFPSDNNETERLIIKAIEAGINYFDTAYIYPNSEQRLGSILTKHNLRDKIYIATKLPLIYVRKMEDFDRFFDEHLKRLQTNYIDYYLMHMLPDMHLWNTLVSMGIREWIEKKKKSGEIRHIGFSFHGTSADFLALLDAYDWEFCQIQYNYVDEYNQAGVNGLKAAAKKGLAVIIMEPLLGGKLATHLPAKAILAFAEADKSISPAGWAFRWLYNQPEVTCVLSGMSSFSQLQENIKTAENAKPNMLTEIEKAVFAEVKETFLKSQKIPCTACNYCMPCPENVSIPGCFNAYNASYSISFMAGLQQYILNAGVASTIPATASRCSGCGKCEKHCPQAIEIRKQLKAVEKRLEPLWFKGVIKIARKFMGR